MKNCKNRLFIVWCWQVSSLRHAWDKFERGEAKVILCIARGFAFMGQDICIEIGGGYDFMVEARPLMHLVTGSASSFQVIDPNENCFDVLLPWILLSLRIDHSGAM